MWGSLPGKGVLLKALPKTMEPEERKETVGGGRMEGKNRSESGIHTTAGGRQEVFTQTELHACTAKRHKSMACEGKRKMKGAGSKNKRQKKAKAKAVQ